MKTKQYNFHTDPGHGWLAVKITELAALGLLTKISPWSYRTREAINPTVYLEEDCDAPLFIEAMKATGVEVKLKRFNCRSRMSKIRNLPSY